MNEAREKERLLKSKRDRLAAFIQAHPDRLDEFFRFTDPDVRELATTKPKELDLGTVTVLCDRMDYLSHTRIVHRSHDVPRCQGKVIYTEKEANGKSNRIWHEGRGRMRVYHCPLCNGHHLTHTADRDAARRVA